MYWGISHPDFHAEIIAELERLRDAIARAGASGSATAPLDLIELGLVSVEEAQELHELETAAAAGTR